MNSREHKHSYELWSYSPNTINFACKCGERISRPATKKDRKIIELDINPLPNLHKAYRAFNKKFLDSNYKPIYRGYEFIEQADKWAEKHPDCVTVIGCDDAMHMSSSIYLIEHRTKDYYHGTTVVFIGQDGQYSNFFLYSSHKNELIKALKKSYVESIKIKKIENRLMQERSRKINKLIKP